METPSFDKPVHRIAEADLFMCMALWMEESPVAEIPLLEDDESADAFTDDSEPTTKRRRTELCSEYDNNTEPENCFRHSPADTDTDGERIHTKLKTGLKANSVSDLDTDRHGELSMTVEEQKDAAERSSNKNGIHKVGTVFVARDGKVLALDCSRDGIHAIVHVLVDFCDRIKDCVVYVSRKPCSSCLKLMIHAGVARVFYLPLEPEDPGESDLERADRLARVCTIGQSIYVPQIGDVVMTQSKSRQSPYTPQKNSHLEATLDLLNRFWDADWTARISKQLRWPEFDSFKKAQTDSSIRSALEWVARVTHADIPNFVHFSACAAGGMPLFIGPENANTSAEVIPKIPDPNNSKWQELALHSSRLAQILSQRSNDPRRGVGAVVVVENRVVAVGWNSYPPQTMYGDFPRASDNDADCYQPKKYPFLVHAEQAALLSRNTQSISDSSTTLFVSKKPCDDCVPLLIKTGVKNVVFPKPTPKHHATQLKYCLLKKMMKQGKIRGFQSSHRDSKTATDAGSLKHITRHLQFNGAIAKS